MIVGIDLGFGWTKARSEWGTVCFPSVVGEGRELFDSEWSEKGIIHPSGKFVGDLAIKQSATKVFSLAERRPDQQVTRILLETALNLVSEGEVSVVTGLPIAWYWEQKDAMKKLIGGKVKVVPQPLGSLMAWLLDENGELNGNAKYAGGSIGIVDVGMHTVDYLYLQGMEVLRPYSHTTRSGIHTALKALDSGLALYEIDQAVMSGSIDARDALNGLAQQIQGEVESFWPSPDVILITGGGGALLYDYLGIGILADEPNLANVEGYFRLGRRTWNVHRVSPEKEERPGTHSETAAGGIGNALGNGKGRTQKALSWRVPQAPKASRRTGH